MCEKNLNRKFFERFKICGKYKLFKFLHFYRHITLIYLF